MSLDGVYVPTERAPDPGSPGEPAPSRVDPLRPGPPPAGPDRGARPTVFLPTRRVRPGDPDFDVEMRHLVDGRVALLTYGSLESLVACCGDAQPWVEIPAARVADVLSATGADTVVEDQELDDTQRHRAEEAP